jgi:hypothetical protein
MPIEPLPRKSGSYRKEMIFMEWITPDFEEYELECEVTAYAAHW